MARMLDPEVEARKMARRAGGAGLGGGAAAGGGGMPGMPQLPSMNNQGGGGGGNQPGKLLTGYDYSGWGPNFTLGGRPAAKTDWDAMTPEQRAAIGLPDWNAYKTAAKAWRANFQPGGANFEFQTSIARDLANSGASSWQDIERVLGSRGIFNRPEEGQALYRRLQGAFQGTMDPSGRYHLDPASGQWVDVGTSDLAKRGQAGRADYHERPGGGISAVMGGLGMTGGKSDIQQFQEWLGRGVSSIEGRDPATGLLINRSPDGSVAYYDEGGYQIDPSTGQTIGHYIGGLQGGGGQRTGGPGMGGGPSGGPGGFMGPGYPGAPAPGAGGPIDLSSFFPRTPGGGGLGFLAGEPKPGGGSTALERIAALQGGGAMTSAMGPGVMGGSFLPGEQYGGGGMSRPDVRGGPVDWRERLEGGQSGDWNMLEGGIPDWMRQLKDGSVGGIGGGGGWPIGGVGAWDNPALQSLLMGQAGADLNSQNFMLNRAQQEYAGAQPLENFLTRLYGQVLGMPGAGGGPGSTSDLNTWGLLAPEANRLAGDTDAALERLKQEMPVGGERAAAAGDIIRQGQAGIGGLRQALQQQALGGMTGIMEGKKNFQPGPYSGAGLGMLGDLTARRGQDVGMRGQDMDYSLGMRGQDLQRLLAMLSDTTTRRGQDLNFDLGGRELTSREKMAQLEAQQRGKDRKSSMWGNLLSTAGGLAGILLSDRRTKTGSGAGFDPFMTPLGGFGTLSDKETKEQVDGYPRGLKDLKKLQVYSFKYKDDAPEMAGEKHVGVMAQDLQKIAPEAVTKEDDGFLRIKPMALLAMTVNSVKDLDKRLVKLSALAERKEKK